MARNSMLPSLHHSEKTTITLLTLLTVFSMTFGLKVLDDLQRFPCPSREEGKHTTCWDFEDENVAVYATQGDCTYMEDRVLFEKNIAGSGVSVYAVFDGHGGDAAVKFVTKNFINVLKNMLTKVKAFNFDGDEKKYFSIDYKTILRETLTTIETELLKNIKTSGTTATIALIDGDKNLVYIANVGDSRVIMGDENGKAHRLSIDHKPTERKERKRIEDAGGSVVYNQGYRIDDLAMSRSLGDFYIKNRHHVIAEPDTFVFDLSRYNPKLLVLTSDGIVDDVPDEAAVAMAESHLNVKGEYFGAKKIAMLAYNRGSIDNITVLIVKMLN